MHMPNSSEGFLRPTTGKLTTAERKARQSASEEGWKREQLVATRQRAEKTARLAALRLAKEATEREAAAALALEKAAKPARKTAARAKDPA
jgi:hypothetical protein